ncbi:MAG TPA: hypothetical protein VGC77_10140 [Rhodopseudomonas sp.]|uniref:hypothetical protein n=1 Tax=Rhodopseudomonas sp. TaxID=1078 RepID=UPI002ED8724D
MRDILVLAYVVVALSTLSFVPSRLGPEIWATHWAIWIKQFQEHGLVAGYYAVRDVYPPMTFSVFALISLLPWPQYATFKVIQSILLFATGVSVYAWRRNLGIATATMLGLAANSMIFESTDIFFTPFLIGALIALADRRWIMFSTLYSIALLFKWQPIILTPFFLIWIWPELRRPRVWAELLVAALVVLGSEIGFFGSEVILGILRAPGARTFFSGNAFNLNWVVGWVNALASGEASVPDLGPTSPMLTIKQYLFHVPGWLWTTSQIVSLTSFAALIVGFGFTKRSPRTLLLFCTTATVSYAMLHTEVHENHLHIAVISSALLAAAAPSYLPVFIFWATAMTFNLFAYLSSWPRVIGGIDVTLLVAAMNVSVFVALWIHTMRQPRWPFRRAVPEAETESASA